MTNAINPSHYKSDTIECIDAMKACSTPEEFRGHLKLTVLKYLWREDKKGEGDQARVENLEKAAWYLDRLVKDLRGERSAGYTPEAESVLNDILNYAIPAETIPPHTINAADQGWIEWRGGDQPAATKGKRVETYMGRDSYSQTDDADKLRWDWKFSGQGGDIRRYRIAK